MPDVQTGGVETQNGKGPGMDTDAAFLDPGARRRLFPAVLMMLSVTFGFWGVATFVPTYVGTVAAKVGLSAPYYYAVARLLGTGVAIVGFISLGFCADATGRKPTAMRLWSGGDDRRLILHPRCRRGAVPTGDERKTAPRHPVAGSGFGRAAGRHQLMVSAPSRISKLFSRFRKLIPSNDTFRFSFTAAATLSIESCSMRISRSAIGASRARPLAVCER